MLKLLGNTTRLCDGIPRREALRVGGMGAFGLSAAGISRLRAAQAAGEQPATGAGQAQPLANAGLPGFGKAKSCILLFPYGSPPQHETFDPKPEAPVEIRGPYQAIPSTVPGVSVCEHLPRLARQMHRLALVRSVTSDDANHNTSLILTGRQAVNGGTATKGFNPGIPFDWPFFMSALQALGAPRTTPPDGALPNNLCLPNRLGRLEGYWRTGPYGGFLGPQFDPVCTQAGKAGERLFQPGGVDFQQLSFTPAGATLGPDLSLDLLSKRQSLLEQLEGARPALDRSAAVRKYTHAQQQSLDLLTSERFRSALDLSREPVETRERYGRNLFGQSVLTARRLVEAGVPLVTALWDCTLESSDIALLSWDTHWDHFQACQRVAAARLRHRARRPARRS